MDMDNADKYLLLEAQKRAKKSDGFMMLDLKIGESDGSLEIHHEFDIRDKLKDLPYIYEGIYSGIIMMLLNKLIRESVDSDAKISCLTQIENFIKISKLGLGSSIKAN